MGLDQLASYHIQNSQCIRDNNCKKQYTGDTGGRGDRINKFAARAAVSFSIRPQCGRWRPEAPPTKGILISCPKAALITPNERKTPCSGAGRKNAGVLLWKSLFVYFSGSQRIPHRVRNQHLHTQNPMDHLTLHEYIRIPFASLAELPPDLLEGP